MHIHCQRRWKILQVIAVRRAFKRQTLKLLDKALRVFEKHPAKQESLTLLKLKHNELSAFLQEIELNISQFLHQLFLHILNARHHTIFFIFTSFTGSSHFNKDKKSINEKFYFC